MSKVVKLQRVNNLMQIIYDDGTREFAYPSNSTLWFVGGELIEVTPHQPTSSGNTVSIPSITGVIYKVGTTVVNGTIGIPLDGSVTVTAVPASGYKFPSGTWSWTFDATSSSGFKFPYVRSGINFSSYYGHSGIDWPYGTGTPIPCIGPGTVKWVNYYSWAGNSVVVDHGTIGGINISSLYAHMSTAPYVGVGDPVSGGTILGPIGETGQATGPHLHLEVIYNGDRLETSTPGNNVPGLGFQRTLAWLDANTDGSSW